MTLPNFLIIGAAKAATTSLHHYLAQHPDVFMSRVKEPAYYAPSTEGVFFERVRTRHEYERLFDSVSGERAIGEASPQYLNDRDAPALIAADLPDVRLIVSLRNPVDRAYSSYLGRISGGAERRSPAEALRRGTYYFESSLYFEPLSRYLQIFGRDRVKVVLFDDITRDVRAVVRELCEFLGVDPRVDFDTNERLGAAREPASVAGNALFMRLVYGTRRLVPSALRGTGIAARVQQLWLRKPAPLSEKIRRQLLAGFRDDVLRTEALIGRSLSHWLEVSG